MKMTFAELTDYVALQNVPFTPEPTAPQPFWHVAAEHLVALAETLRSDERLYFDQLACLTAIDNGPDAGTLDVVYNFYSIPYGHTLMVRVTVPRDDARLPTLSHLWRTADWHEREAFDLVGVAFIGHPDLRRILLPADWPGHPLRNDYAEPERYHGIQTT